MGWHTGYFAINASSVDYWKLNPVCEPSRVQTVVRTLGWRRMRSRGLVDWESAYGSSGHTVAIGAYESALLVLGEKVVDITENYRGRRVKRLLGLYPKSLAVAVFLEDSCDAVAYILWTGGDVIRAWGGAPGQGAWFDEGRLQPEENELVLEERTERGVEHSVNDILLDRGSEVAFRLLDRVWPRVFTGWDLKQLMLELFDV